MDLNELHLAGRLLKGVQPARLRALAVEALRRSRGASRPTSSREIELTAFGWKLANLLAESHDANMRAEVGRQKPSFAALFSGDALAHEQMSPVLDLVAWLCTAGLAFPRVGNPNTEYVRPRPVLPTALLLTSAGLRVVDAADDHPLLPGFVARVAARCPGLPEEGTEPFLDAYACLERGLARPAIVLLGVGYEAFVERVLAVLIARSHLAGDLLDKGAAKRIEAIRAVVPSVVADKDERFGVLHALDFADRLRERRNDASHTSPRFAFDDIGEVEELMTSAGRHLPTLWRLTL